MLCHGAQAAIGTNSGLNGFRPDLEVDCVDRWLAHRSLGCCVFMGGYRTKRRTYGG